LFRTKNLKVRQSIMHSRIQQVDDHQEVLLLLL
jgi:hypothetical protein